MTRDEFKIKAIKIMIDFGLPSPPKADSSFEEIFVRVQSECSMAEDLHKNMSTLLCELE